MQQRDGASASARSTLAEESRRMPAAPIAARRPQVITQHGRERVDEYAWLKDPAWQEVMRDPARLDPAIRAHLEAENAYTEAMTAASAGLRETLFQEMKGRIKDDDASAPSPDGPYSYYIRFAPGAQHPIHARSLREGGSEEILLDEEALAQGGAYCSVAAAHHSPGHDLYAYALDRQGSEYYRVHVLRLADRTELGGPLDSCTGDFVFSPDGGWLFWVWKDANGRPAKVFRRPVGSGPEADALVYAEPDEGFFLGVEVSESRAFIVISAGNQETSEAWVIPAEAPTAPPQCFAPREAGVRYEITHWDGGWCIRTNADGAVDFKVMRAPLEARTRARWTEWLAHVPGRLVLGLAAYRDHLVRLERTEALPQLVVCARADGAEHVISFEEEVYDLGLAPGFVFDTPCTRFVYQSPTTPRQWVDYDMAARSRTVVKTQEVPSGHDPSAYVARRLWAQAPDGARVPITLVARKDAPQDGSAPVLLYGYGAYGAAMPANFSVTRLSLLDRGWIYAIAHVRGGSEMGWGWFLDGRKERKPNNFTDFIACAETLIAQGLTRTGRIVAHGGSAGGLLVGAALNLRPDLWAGVIAAVPFVDVLNTMSDASLPLTPPEWPEWGDPITDPEAFDRIAAYSPYDQVHAAAYPAVLATGGLSDPRVTYWEPAKWVARLRASTLSDRPVLLHMQMQAGHGGASGRYDALGELAREYAFALQCLEDAPAATEVNRPRA